MSGCGREKYFVSYQYPYGLEWRFYEFDDERSALAHITEARDECGEEALRGLRVIYGFKLDVVPVEVVTKISFQWPNATETQHENPTLAVNGDPERI